MATSSVTVAAYNTYVIANRAPGRFSPTPGAGVIRYFSCGTVIYIQEVSGTNACSCNECTSAWGRTATSSGYAYIHRGNLNPYNGGACECYY